MADKIDDLTRRISELDKKLYGYKIGAIIFGVTISIFLYFQWTQIPKKAEEAVTKELTQEVHSKIKRAAIYAQTILESKDLVNKRFNAGTTGAGITKWEKYDKNTVKVYVDTSSYNFSNEPIYIISLAGDTDHFTAIGTASIYSPTKNGFNVYVKHSGVTPESANKRSWRINWIAIER